MVLNNMGQAYAGLGETDTAMVYLGRAIRAVPMDPGSQQYGRADRSGQGEYGKGRRIF